MNLIQFDPVSTVVIIYSIGWWITLCGLSYLQHHGTYDGKVGLSYQKWNDDKCLAATYFWPIYIPLYSKEIHKAIKTIIAEEKRKRIL